MCWRGVRGGWDVADRMNSDAPQPDVRIPETTRARLLGLCCFVLLQAGWVPPVWSQQADSRVKIAVLDFALNLTMANAGETERDERPVTMAVSHMRTQVAGHDAYILVETRLDPSASTEWPCTSDTCAVQAGKHLSVPAGDSGPGDEGERADLVCVSASDRCANG